MKATLALGLVAVLLAATAPQTLAAKEIPEFIKKCMEENKVTEEDAKKFVESGKASEAMKCNLKCILLETKAMTEDGKFVLERILPHVPEKIHAAFKECVTIETSADLCDLAFRHNTCLREKAPEWFQEMAKYKSS